MPSCGDGDIRVLHVDDDISFAELTADFLQREHEAINVATETSAEAGLDRLTSEQFECVVSDYQMPHMNGLEFLEAVRERSPDLPFILFTGMGSEEVASEAISKGVTDYLQKGLGMSQYTVLANRIKNAVEQDRAARAVEVERSRRSQLFDRSPDPIFEVKYEEDARVIVQSVNPAFNEAFCQSEGDIVGSDVIEAFGKEFTCKQDQMDSEYIRKQVYEGKPVIQEVIRSTNDGLREYLLRVFPFDIDEATRRAYGWFIDVTDQKAPSR